MFISGPGKLLINLYDYAVKLDRVETNPALRTDKYKVKVVGRHTWTEEEIDQFEARHAPGTKARLAMNLILYTAQRRSDMVKMQHSDIIDGRIAVQQKKTNKKLLLPIHPKLAETLLATELGKTYFLETERGMKFSDNGIGNWFRTQCDEAGLPNCTAHGLRKAAARRMAEAGATNQQIKAMTGHSKDDEVALYTAAADQVRIAEEVMKKLSV